MAKVKSVIKSITVHYPLPENQEEFDRRFAKAAVNTLKKKFEPEVILAAIERLEQEEKLKSKG